MKELASCNELLVYFVTGTDEPHPNWEQYLKTVLLKDFNVLPAAIELGPRLP